ncbi:uncharacterized protein PHALS_14672 [Plasmopara halstedii]|uniref:Uncharacterized protein n=1 Tax=Plasmopara halstedii TaxID=4781 RepID=A0A0N7L611_PLAHL|nr:uncharacterized protein PHALS_14672 [Plasmopara halstedii]CEG42979.1 hypothetical protein PHALS_14672 [Plasmopara halstedii]|eukprot:XP_024579348.1 hypothetical protein PHALS_14672 [Plasmopara halstedii]
MKNYWLVLRAESSVPASSHKIQNKIEKHRHSSGIEAVTKASIKCARSYRTLDREEILTQKVRINKRTEAAFVSS